jgi:hypothetical protein
MCRQSTTYRAPSFERKPAFAILLRAALHNMPRQEAGVQQVTETDLLWD